MLELATLWMTGRRREELAPCLAIAPLSSRPLPASLPCACVAPAGLVSRRLSPKTKLPTMPGTDKEWSELSEAEKVSLYDTWIARQ